METKNRGKGYLNKFLKVALGAGTVVGGAYVYSRLKEKQAVETRLERMEQIMEEVEKGNLASEKK